MSSRPKPSATVVVVRDTDGLELLLLQRTRGEGAWVFPGGKIDPGDGLDPSAAWEDGPARRAAVREAREEARLALDPSTLVPISRWITPEVSPRRFDTMFFLARVGADVPVRVDGGEIRGHRWLAPSAALDAYRRKEMQLAPPTFVTITWLAEHARSEDALRALGEAESIVFRPRICRSEAFTCILYPGDAGYEASDPAQGGPRHRLWVEREGWRYERNPSP